MSRFTELADHISFRYDLRLPPHDEDKAFVKIFRTLLTEEEAELLLVLDSRLHTPKDIASMAGRDQTRTEEMLRDIARKGIIVEVLEAGQACYRLLPFVPGIFEALGKLAGHPEIARYLDQYAAEMAGYKDQSRIGESGAGQKETAERETGDHETLIHMNQRIEVRTDSLGMDEIRLYLRRTDRFAVMDCICRAVKSTNGMGCGHSIKDMCIIAGEYVDYYVRIGNARRISREEVLEVLERAEEEGLVHEVYPIEKSSSFFICNCCACGCMFMAVSDRIRKVIRYDNAVRINEALCTHCGSCIDCCPQQVFAWGAGASVLIAEDQCIRCGLCNLECPSGAIICESR